MKVIQLTQGQTTIVDDEDFELFGHLKWHYSHGRAVRRPGKWARDKHGVDIKSTEWLHREIMGDPEGVFVDHINGNALDNRRENLRLCTKRENSANQQKRQRVSSSRYKGVYYAARNKNHWQAYIGSSRAGERTNLGSYATEQEAAAVYNKAAKQLYGDFARLNDIEPLQ